MKKQKRLLLALSLGTASMMALASAEVQACSINTITGVGGCQGDLGAGYGNPPPGGNPPSVIQAISAMNWNALPDYSPVSAPSPTDDDSFAGAGATNAVPDLPSTIDNSPTNTTVASAPAIPAPTVDVAASNNNGAINLGTLPAAPAPSSTLPEASPTGPTVVTATLGGGSYESAMGNGGAALPSAPSFGSAAPTWSTTVDGGDNPTVADNSGYSIGSHNGIPVVDYNGDTAAFAGPITLSSLTTMTPISRYGNSPLVTGGVTQMRFLAAYDEVMPQGGIPNLSQKIEILNTMRLDAQDDGLNADEGWKTFSSRANRILEAATQDDAGAWSLSYGQLVGNPDVVGDMFQGVTSYAMNASGDDYLKIGGKLVPIINPNITAALEGLGTDFSQQTLDVLSSMMERNVMFNGAHPLDTASMTNYLSENMDWLLTGSRYNVMSAADETILQNGALRDIAISNAVQKIVAQDASSGVYDSILGVASADAGATSLSAAGPLAEAGFTSLPVLGTIATSVIAAYQLKQEWGNNYLSNLSFLDNAPYLIGSALNAAASALIPGYGPMVTQYQAAINSLPSAPTTVNLSGSVDAGAAAYNGMMNSGQLQPGDSVTLGGGTIKVPVNSEPLPTAFNDGGLSPYNPNTYGIHYGNSNSPYSPTTYGITIQNQQKGHNIRSGAGD